jgi:hypothetical protein
MPYLNRAIVFLFCLFYGSAGAQVFQSQQKKLFRATGDTLVLDTLSLVPGTVQFRTFPANSTQPAIEYKLHALIFKGLKPDSILVSYKRFPYNFEKSYFHKDQGQLYMDISRQNPFTIRFDKNQKHDLFLNDGLSKNGNISRGISFGNNQDVVVNSNLNLQVSGKLTPEIDLLMAATDNNIPFQADGTTAQLQEFDKVFIQLSNENNKLVVGDYQLSRPQNSYFMNFYKRAQGFQAENVFRDTIGAKAVKFNTSIAGAVSKGKFARQVFYGTENNQGPYRLRGAENEMFIIVLSGTEKIYIDGRLLQRGQENDYIIDYNTAELTFTAKQLITKDKRIVAEFQYAERNYARSLFFFGEEMQSEKTKVYLNYFSEQDNKNRPLQQTLTQDQKDVMIGVGDSIHEAYYSGVEEAVFNTNDVFYRQVDTLVDGIPYEDVYVYSTDAEQANYRLKFSNVGTGRGNYMPSTTNANGKVFVWISPLDGQSRGAYEPVIPLVTPKKQEMLTGGFTHSVNPNQAYGAEGVYTKYDINRFSSLDKRNDEGAGVKLFSKNDLPLAWGEGRAGPRAIVNVQYEFLQQRFKQVERFRSVEFERDWNRPLNGAVLNDQHIASTELGFVKDENSGANYIVSVFNEGDSYKGLKHNLSAHHTFRGMNMRYSGSLLGTQDETNNQSSNFYRHKSLVSQRIEKVKVTFSDEYEKNLFYRKENSMLLPRAYNFWEWEASISNADSSENNAKLFYRERRDKLAYGNELNDSTFAKNIGFQASVYSIKNNPVSVLVTYRQLELKNVVSTALKPDNTLLSRIEYNPRYFSGLVGANIFYETGYGMENKREFHYLEVAPGQGQFTWNDYNKNGIRELNEFEVGQFSDQLRYVRVFTPTNEYVKVLHNQLSFAMNIRPAAIMRHSPAKGLTAFINRWALQTALRYDNRISDGGMTSNYSPFVQVADSQLLARNNNLRQSVFFNQSSAVFGADYTYINNQSRMLLTNGIENRDLMSHEVKARINVWGAWSLNSLANISQKTFTSEYLSARNFLILSSETEHQLAFQPNTVFRLSTRYKYTEKQNSIGARERAYLNTYGIEMKANQAEKGSLTGRCDVILITYNGEMNSSLAYEMLSGLRSGRNFTWELSYQRNLNSVLQVSISYNGRRSPDTPVVHLGGAQVRAFF